MFFKKISFKISQHIGWLSFIEETRFADETKKIFGFFYWNSYKKHIFLILKNIIYILKNHHNSEPVT
jgi:hypothetical protein